MPTGISDEDRVYCDTSALVKLVVGEAESLALRSFLGRRPMITSELSLTEVPRAVRRRELGEAALRRVEALLERLELVLLSRETLHRAASYRAADLRALDAIHLASAEDSAASFEYFVSYDSRQLRAAKAAGLDVRSPA